MAREDGNQGVVWNATSSARPGPYMPGWIGDVRRRRTLPAQSNHECHTPEAYERFTGTSTARGQRGARATKMPRLRAPSSTSATDDRRLACESVKRA